jgi:transcriptional repressor NrdR
MVQKRSGIIEDFDYEKLYKGIENAFGGLDINDKKLKTLVDNIHNEIKDHGNKVKTEIIGETVLSNLKKTNKVAYLRFASVYKEFSDASDFEKEVAEL